jgi:hypothetical protein
MKEFLSKISGNMDESLFYKKLAKNTVYALLLMIGLVGVVWALYNYTTPVVLALFALGVASTQNSYWLSAIVIFAAFLYIFNVHTFWRGLQWGLFAIVYAAITYLMGEVIIIMIIALGILFTIAFVFGQTTFTGILTYFDLKEWVKLEMIDVEKCAEAQYEAQAEEGANNE